MQSKPFFLSSGAPTVRVSGLVADMLAKLSPATVVWKTMSKQFTAAEMYKLLCSKDTTEAHEWLSGLLRVIRDVIAVRTEDTFGAAPPTQEHLAAAQRVDKQAFKSLIQELEPSEPCTFWSPVAKQVDCQMMLRELGSNSDVAVSYVAHFIQALDDMLKGMQAG